MPWMDFVIVNEAYYSPLLRNEKPDDLSMFVARICEYGEDMVERVAIHFLVRYQPNISMCITHFDSRFTKV